MPVLSCLKITGPLLVSFMATAMTAKSGSRSIIAGSDINISKIRLEIFPIISIVIKYELKVKKTNYYLNNATPILALKGRI